MILEDRQVTSSNKAENNKSHSTLKKGE